MKAILNQAYKLTATKIEINTRTSPEYYELSYALAGVGFELADFDDDTGHWGWFLYLTPRPRRMADHRYYFMQDFSQTSLTRLIDL